MHQHHKHHKQGRHHAGLPLLGRRQLRQGSQACMAAEVDCRDVDGEGGAREGARLWFRQRQGKAGLVIGWWLGKGKGQGTRAKGTRAQGHKGEGRRAWPLAIQSDWQNRFLHLGPTGRIEINPVRPAGSISASGSDWRDRINPVRPAGSISATGSDWQDRNQPSPIGRINFCSLGRSRGYCREAGGPVGRSPEQPCRFRRRGLGAAGRWVPPATLDHQPPWSRCRGVVISGAVAPPATLDHRPPWSRCRGGWCRGEGTPAGLATLEHRPGALAPLAPYQLFRPLPTLEQRSARRG